MDQELIDYLSSEYMDCIEQEEEWIQKKFELQAEQRRFEENLYFHVEEEQIRQLFSPLILHRDKRGNELAQENYQLSDVTKRLHHCMEQLEEINEKKSKLKRFINTVSVMKQKLEEEKVEHPPLFLASFYEILERMERMYPDTDFVYEIEEQEAACYLSFHFLSMWKEVTDYLMDQMLINAILFRIQQKKKTVIIMMECESSVPLGRSGKKGLENVLTEECELVSWEQNTFEIHMTVK